MSRRWTLCHFVLLAAFVAIGIQVVWYTGLTIGYETISSAWPTQTLGQVLVDPEGAVVVENYLPTGVSYRTVDGEPVAVGETRTWLDAAYLAAPLDERWRSATIPWASRTAQFSLSSPPATDWFFVHAPVNDGLGYFVGYDVASKSLVGYLGRHGFRAGLPPQDEWFAVAGPPYGRMVGYAASYRYMGGRNVIDAASLVPKSHVYLIADGQLWRVDLHRRTVGVLYQASDAVSVAATTGVPRDRIGGPAGDGAAAVEAEYPHKGLILRTSTEIVALDFDGRRRTARPLPAQFQAETFVWYELADGIALAQSDQRYNGVTWFRDLWWIDRQGGVTRTARVELAPGAIESSALQIFGFAALAPTTLLTVPVALIAIPLQAVEQGWQPDYPTALASMLVDAWPAIVVLCGLSALLAWLAYRRQTRFALPGAGVWAVFVLLLGVPGWLAYRLHRRWPVMKACDQCQRSAPRDRDTCAACGHLFAPPSSLGTEVFA